MARFRLVRLVRTASSEIYVIWDDSRRVGQVDLHYGDDTIHATVVFEAAVSEDEQQELYSQIDEDIVSSYLPSFQREDLIFTVFRGQEVDSFSYPQDEEIGEAEE